VSGISLRDIAGNNESSGSTACLRDEQPKLKSPYSPNGTFIFLGRVINLFHFFSLEQRFLALVYFFFNSFFLLLFLPFKKTF